MFLCAFFRRVFLLLLLARLSSFASAENDNRHKCRRLPGDRDWPSPSAWAELNATVGGRLISTVPLAAPCHQPSYDAQKCASIQERWPLAHIHIESPSSFWAPQIQLGMCSPFQPSNSTCPLGNLPSYSINVTSASDITAGVAFARRHNIRLSIKNTGHDWLGKSSGKGSLGIWTHNLNAIEPLLNYSSPAYTGPAMKLGAGVQSSAAYLAAHRLGYRIIGGSCPSVGIAGGFSQGGGYSPLTPLHGLGADNVLEWEVVTADGTHTVATPSRNPDLYWALSGGGGGTYAVVVSMTARIHRDVGSSAGARLFFNASSASSADVYWRASEVFFSNLLPAVDARAHLIFGMSNQTAYVLASGQGQSEGQLGGHLQRLLDYLDSHGIKYAFELKSHTSFYEAFDYEFGPLPDGLPQPSQILSTRFIARSDFSSSSSPASPAALTKFIRAAASEPGFGAVVVGMRTPQPEYGQPAGDGSPAPGAVAANSVQPQWRTAAALVYVGAGWDFTAAPGTNERNHQLLTHRFYPELAALTPDSAPYLNEADNAMPGLVRATFGRNLARLRRIKAHWDPHDLLYAQGAVGSDEWTLTEEGRLCKNK